MRGVPWFVPIVALVAYFGPTINIDDPVVQRLATIGAIIGWWYLRWEAKSGS